MNKEIDISRVVLSTPRLVIRPWSMTDLDDFYDYAKVDGVGEMAGWAAHKNKDETRQILERFIEGKITFAIVSQSKVVGSIGIERYDEDMLPEFSGKSGREIGYVLSKEYWGRGLMTEAVRRVVRWLFEEEQLDFVVAGHFVTNRKSQRVLEKCGFRHYKKEILKTRNGPDREGWVSVLER